jgi:tetratricopeptide (TPR) repeat protein
MSNPYAFNDDHPHDQRQSSALGGLIRRLIKPLLLLLIICGVVLGVLFVIAQMRSIYFANGTTAAYDITVNGRKVTLPPETGVKVRCGVGEHTVEILTGPFAGETLIADCSAPLFANPIHSPVFVVNPDQLAVIEWEQCGYYDENLPQTDDDPNYKVDYHVAELVHRFGHVDYPFAVFPPRLNLDQYGDTIRTRLSVAGSVEPYFVTMMLADDGRDPAPYARRLVIASPDDEIALHTLSSCVDNQEFAAIVKPMLEARPVQVEAHRAYQNINLAAGDTDRILGVYRQLLDDDPDNPALLYLLGRVTPDIAESDRLYQASATHETSTFHPHRALCMNHLASGDFAPCVAAADEVLKRSPRHFECQVYRVQALLALGRDSDAQSMLESMRRWDPGNLWCEHMMLIATHRDDPLSSEANAQIAQTTLRLGGDPYVRAYLTAEQHYMAGELDEAAAKFLELTEFYYQPFCGRIILNQLDLAEELLEDAPGDIADYSALAAAAHLAQDAEQADRCVEKVIELMRNDSNESVRVAAMLAGEAPFDRPLIQRTLPNLSTKLPLLIVLGQRFPEHRAFCFDLAEKLNFIPAFPSHLVDQAVLGE